MLSSATTSIDRVGACVKAIVVRLLGGLAESALHEAHAAAVAERDAVICERDAIAAECYRLAELLWLESSADASAVGKQAFEGFQMYGWRDDLLVSAHILNGAYEPAVTAVFRRHLRPGMYVIDIGANVGYFSMLAGAIVGPDGRVDAIEANPKNAKMIEVNRRVNGFTHVRIANVAVGAEMGLLSLRTHYSNGSTPRLADDVFAPLSVQTVPSMLLGQIIDPNHRVDFIKIDVEGAEYNVLFGAEEIIRRDRPFIVSEFSPHLLSSISNVTANKYLSFLVECGLDLGVILATGDVEKLGSDPAEVMKAWNARGGVYHIDIVAFPRS